MPGSGAGDGDGDAVRSRSILRKIAQKIEMQKLNFQAWRPLSREDVMTLLVKALNGRASIHVPQRDFKKRNMFKYEDFLLPEAVMDRMEDAILYGLILSSHGPKCIGPFRLTRRAMQLWKLLEACYMLLERDLAHTQGTLCYLLSTDSEYDCFSKESHVSKAISGLEELLQCSRCCFGILATKRGMVAGPLSIQLSPEVEPEECWNGFDLPRQLSELENMKLDKLDKEVEYIIVVQEEHMFENLVDNADFKGTCSIVITGEGLPEFTTRFFLHRLSMRFPQVPIFCLTDWSPVGLEVLCAYKYGMAGAGPTRNRLACSSMEWLGLRYEHVQELQVERKPAYLFSSLLQKLSQEDLKSARRLSGKLCGDYEKELDIMVEKDSKTYIVIAQCYYYKLISFVFGELYTLKRSQKKA